MARIDQINTQVGFPAALPHVPANYPTRPQPGKISLLFAANSTELYHKFSPYTDRDSYFGIFPNRQPFVYKFIDEAQNSTFNQLPAAVKTLALATNIPSAIDDLVRVSKFSISPKGVIYNAKQVTLQLLNRFDETRIYNPLSPLLATIQPATLGIGERPLRHIEGGILGLVNSITSTVGINIQSGFQTPASTMGDAALAPQNLGQGKGLIRGGDAGLAYTNVVNKWNGNTTSGGGSFLASLLSAAASRFVGTATPRQPQDAKFRWDDTMYQTMVLSGNPLLKTTDQTGQQILPQMWYGFTNWKASPPRSKMFSFPVIDGGFQYIDATTEMENISIKGRDTGYQISDPNQAKYGDLVKPVADGSFTNSDMLVQFGLFADEANIYEDKFNDPISDKVKALSDNLQKVISGIGNKTVYTISTSNTYSKLISSGDVKSIGFDVLFNSVPAAQTAPNQYGASGEYNNSGSKAAKTIDKSIRSIDGGNLRFSTTFASDGLNSIGIIGKNRQIPYDPGLAANYKNWKEYKPYEDDLIAFFFYDVVNEKYIPFRATVKAISEGNTAFWDELRFIGRADQLYSYNGFSRTLSFTFNVVISSITELLPTWKKINYMASAVKPSNYTVGVQVQEKFNRFIVPPMFMVTIGDMYKFQPIVITSLNVNIPDDASWETLNEDNAPDGWNYLNGIISAPTIGKHYGQYPKEAEIAVTCNLLEKERAQVGGSHFGHAPRVDDWESQTGDNQYAISGSVPFLPAPSAFSKDMIEVNKPSFLLLENPEPQPTTTTGQPLIP